MMAALLFLLTATAVLLPMLPALIEWRWPSDVVPLHIDTEDALDPPFLARSFVARLRTAVAEGQLRLGRSLIALAPSGEVWTFIERERRSRLSHRVWHAVGDIHLPAGMAFLAEVAAGGHLRTAPREVYRALSAAGLPAIEGFELTGSWSEQWGREAVAALFGKAVVPDALFCGNDQIARGALDALRERGVAVPDTVAVVGFDNWDVMVEAARPPLTSVDMNLEAMGEEAGERLLAMIAGERAAGVRRLPCTLIVRQTCGGDSRTPRDRPN